MGQLIAKEKPFFCYFANLFLIIWRLTCNLFLNVIHYIYIYICVVVTLSKDGLHRFRHQVFASDEAEDGYLVVLVEDAEGAEYLVQRGTAVLL